jgi:hypothetical protein
MFAPASPTSAIAFAGEAYGAPVRSRCLQQGRR